MGMCYSFINLLMLKISSSNWCLDLCITFDNNLEIKVD